jgi:hypothetical protein
MSKHLFPKEKDAINLVKNMRTNLKIHNKNLFPFKIKRKYLALTAQKSL